MWKQVEKIQTYLKWKKKVFIDPKGTFSISIAIKGIGISCSAGFQQPFWKLIGFDRLSSGKEMTGGGRRRRRRRRRMAS